MRERSCRAMKIPKKLFAVLCSMAGILLLLFLWQLASETMSGLVIASPEDTFQAFGKILTRTDFLSSHFRISMQQRVALARALAIKPDLLLMDEPFNGLDPHLKDSIFNLLEKRIEEYFTTVLYVSHDLEELSRPASRTIHFEGGKLT